MRILFKYGLSLLFAFYILPASICAQEIKTNAKGEKIIVYPDGSWKYFSKKSQVDPFGSNPVANSNIKGTDNNKGENGSDNAFRYLVELSEEALVLKRSVEEQLEQEQRRYNSLRQKQQEYFDGLISLDSKQLAILNRQLYKADLTESLCLRRFELAEKLVVLTNSMQGASREERGDLYKVYVSTKEDLRVLLDQEVIFEDQVEIKSELNEKPKESSANTSSRTCSFAFNGNDPITGKLRRTLEPTFLFSNTPEALKDYFPESDMIECSASITELGGGKVFLLLEVKINSPNAKNAYGGIGRNSILTLKTFDDEQIRLVCSLGDEGHYNDINNVYTFRAQYPISRGEQKVLKRSEVDQVRVVWKTGYEDYEILNVDFFINQFDCLK
jgi:hypothetical protein